MVLSLAAANRGSRSLSSATGTGTDMGHGYMRRYIGQQGLTSAAALSSRLPADTEGDEGRKIMETDGRNEATEMENFLSQPAPSAADHPHDQDQPMNKNKVTKQGLLKVITQFALDLIPSFLSALLF